MSAKVTKFNTELALQRDFKQELLKPEEHLKLFHYGTKRGHKFEDQDHKNHFISNLTDQKIFRNLTLYNFFYKLFVVICNFKALYHS